ncbi:MAG: tetratricopeptide repeat protein [Pirellulales bacterium]
MRHALFATAVWLVSLFVLAAAAAGASQDERFLDGLRAKRLFELAEKYCADRLSDPRVSESRRADLTIELSRTLAQHALEAPPAEAPRLWSQAERVVEDFAARRPQDPKLTLIRVQGALAMAAHGEAACEESRGSSESTAVEPARGVLRRAIAELGELADEIAGQLKRRGRAPGGENELSTDQFQSLELNVRFELARALRNQALSYRPGTADRINSLSRAIESLAGVLAQQSATPLVWSAAIEEIACFRLLGEYPQAESKLARLEKSQPPPEFAEQLRAERIRVALARGQIDDALSEAGVSARQQPAGAHLEFARLEALVAAWRRAGERHNEAEASDWQRRAVQQVRAIERSYGPRWMRKAETLLARAMADSTGPQTAELLAQAAASYYRSGQVDKSIAAYDRAREQARDQRQPETAFDLGFTAAAIEKDRKHYGDALARYRALAHAFPQEPKAPQAHLLAVYCAAQLAQAREPPNLDEYERLLREHVATWPASPTASQAWTWLGRLAEHRHSWQDAIEALAHVKAGDPQFADAVRALGRAYEAWLDELDQRGQSGERLADKALAWLESVTPARGSKPNAATRAATLAAARIWLKEIPAGAMPAERLLRAAIEYDPDAPEDWKTAARRLLVPALAAQGKRAQTDELLEQIPHTSTADALALFQILSDIRRRSSGDEKRKLAEVELGAEDNLLARPGELDAATRRVVTRERAVTLAALGRRKEARAELQALARAFPRDGQTQEELASLLAAGDENDLEAALAKWSEVAAHSRPGTPRWFRAHYGLARTELNLGQVTAARATIASLASKYPDFGGERMKRQFDDLSAEIDEPPRRGTQSK